MKIFKVNKNVMNKEKEEANNWNYEESVKEIEKIIEQIESGELPLEQVFENFALAVKKINQCEKFLDRGKEKMSLLIETLAEEETI